MTSSILRFGQFVRESLRHRAAGGVCGWGYVKDEGGDGYSVFENSSYRELECL
jgi:hypothetical protein